TRQFREHDASESGRECSGEREFGTVVVGKLEADEGKHHPRRRRKRGDHVQQKNDCEYQDYGNHDSPPFVAIVGSPARCCCGPLPVMSIRLRCLIALARVHVKLARLLILVEYGERAAIRSDQFHFNLVVFPIQLCVCRRVRQAILISQTPGDVAHNRRNFPLKSGKPSLPTSNFGKPRQLVSRLEVSEPSASTKSSSRFERKKKL